MSNYTLGDDVLEAVTLSDHDPVAREIVRLADLKAKIAELEAEAKFVSERVIKEIDSIGFGSVQAEKPDGDFVRATVVRSHTKEVNLAELEKVDAALFEKITVRKVDGKALDRAIHAGKFLDPNVSRTVSIKERAPYVRISSAEINGD